MHLALSDDGTLVYQTGAVEGAGQWEFVWVTRSGQATPVDAGFTFASRGGNFGWRLSPDGTQVVYSGGDYDVWIKHLPDGPRDRITFYEGPDYRPFWRPNGDTVTYFSGPSAEDRSVWSRRADGTGEPVLVLDDVRSFSQGSWSADGEWLVLRAAATEEMGFGLRDILAFRPGVDSAAVPLVASPEFAEGEPALSPDGRWLAYSSDETGRREVFVRPFPNVDSRVTVSTDGGLGPLWAHSGRELFFVDEELALVAVQFDPDTGQVLGRETLFALPPGYAIGIAGNNFYDITSDDERFLMVRAYEGDADAEGPATEVIVVENFFEELKERVGG